MLDAPQVLSVFVRMGSHSQLDSTLPVNVKNELEFHALMNMSRILGDEKDY